MKISSTIFFILVKTTILCQTYQIASDSLIKKYHIKKISAFMVDDKKNEIRHFIYQYDSLGNSFTREWFQENADEDNDRRIMTVKFFYMNKLLTKTISFGGSRESTRLDTTIFIYDHMDRLLSKNSNIYKCKKSAYGGFEGYERDETNVILHEYLNDTIVIVKEETSDWHRNQRQDYRVSYDTLIYNRDKLLLCEINQRRKAKITYVYNNKGQMISRTHTPNDPAGLLHLETFIYKDGHLIREEILSFNKDRSYTDSRSIEYINDEHGLVQIYKLNPTNSMIYKYEYY